LARSYASRNWSRTLIRFRLASYRFTGGPRLNRFLCIRSARGQQTSYPQVQQGILFPAPESPPPYVSAGSTPPRTDAPSSSSHLCDSGWRCQGCAERGRAYFECDQNQLPPRGALESLVRRDPEGDESRPSIQLTMQTGLAGFTLASGEPRGRDRARQEFAQAFLRYRNSHAMGSKLLDEVRGPNSGVSVESWPMSTEKPQLNGSMPRPITHAPRWNSRR